MPHIGNVAVLGTSSEELYLVRRYGRTLNADRLQRSRGLFANLFTSGARLIGMSASAPSDGRVVKLLPVPMSFFLLALGSSSLCLWSDWTNPGSEQLVWDIGLKDILAGDLSDLNLSMGACTMADACLMPVEAGDEKGTLLVLSSCGTSLWLHTLSVTFSSESIGSTVTILHRLLLSERGDSEHARIHHSNPSWKIFVSWSAEGHARDHDRREGASGATKTVHGAQIDVLNQSLLNATVSREGDQRTRQQALMDAIRCTNAVNSHIDAATVLDAALVKGHDGVVIITNGTKYFVLCVAPHLVS